MPLLTINLNTCTKCGICSQSCPIQIIIPKDGIPAVPDNFEKGCIKCGHCVSICPTGALDNSKTPINQQVIINKDLNPSSESAEQFLRSRRSIRCFKEEKAPKEVIERLMNIARFAPTGGNTQNISYLVIEDQEKKKKMTEMVVDWMEKEIENNVPWAQMYSGVVAVYRKTGNDIILRNAPHIIIAKAPKNFPLGRDNTCFSLAYAELFAPAIGLGTCWAGFLDMCLSSRYDPLAKLIQLDDNTKVTGALLAGYPKYSYHRMPDRNPLNIQWI